jgi:predicted metalloendopeptidase
MIEKVLVTRENVICSEMTKEQFVSLMLEDLKNALAESYNVFGTLAEIKHKESIEKNKQRVIENLTKYAESKWKTEKRRNLYIETELEKYCNTPVRFYPVRFFDLDVWPGSNGISGYCVLSVNASSIDLERCYDEIVNNEYFKCATGWRFVEKRSSRSQIELIMPEEMTKKYYMEEQNLTNAISNFYSNSKYWGD